MSTADVTISVDLADPTPPYEQVRRQIATLIETGRLAVGDRLPPLRHLARDLGLAVGTVNRAYRELESAGMIRTSRGGGTQVIARPAPSPQQRAARLAEIANLYATSASALGVTATEAHEALADAWPQLT